jgi:hypothetical protein
MQIVDLRLQIEGVSCLALQSAIYNREICNLV